MTQQTIVFLGFGDIATRAAEQLLAANTALTVVGMCRHPENKTAPAGVRLVAGDAGNEQDLKEVLLDETVTAVVMTLTPSGRDRDSYHEGYVVPCRHVQQVLSQRQQPPQLLYISSTGVYAQRDGEQIDETSLTEPTSPSGEMLLQAEQVIQHANAQVSILRCSGIYGPGREMLICQLRSGDAVATPAWTNRIHADDVAGFICHLLLQAKRAESVYLVTDNESVPQAEVYEWLATKLDIDPATISHSDKVGPRGSKKCTNERLRQSGYQLKYPSFREGYAALLERQ